jgi:hypothetical protein
MSDDEGSGSGMEGEEDTPMGGAKGCMVGVASTCMLGIGACIAMINGMFGTHIKQPTVQDTHVSMWNNRMGGFEYKQFPRAQIAQNMLWSNCNGINAVGARVPKQLGGLWWMDGNPAPETVASFGHAIWYPGVAACRNSTLGLASYTQAERNAGVVRDAFGLNPVPCQGRMIVAFWEDRIWAMPETKIGHAYEVAGTTADSHMEFVCGGPSEDDLQICTLGASVGPGADSGQVQKPEGIGVSWRPDVQRSNGLQDGEGGRE